MGVKGPLHMPKGRDNYGVYDPVEGAGAADVDNVGGNLCDIVRMEEILAESSSRTGAGKTFAV